ncbi:MAG: hypothetical protein WBV73_17025 [Phormidium sp.]
MPIQSRYRGYIVLFLPANLTHQLQKAAGKCPSGASKLNVISHQGSQILSATRQRSLSHPH